MKKTITSSQFHDAFQRRRPDQFSHAGLNALFDYFSEYEDSTGVEVEFDVIGICCDFTAYEDLEELQKEHDIETIEELQGMTLVLEFEGGIIIQNY